MPPFFRNLGTGTAKPFSKINCHDGKPIPATTSDFLSRTTGKFLKETHWKITKQNPLEGYETKPTGKLWDKTHRKILKQNPPEKFFKNPTGNLHNKSHVKSPQLPRFLVMSPRNHRKSSQKTPPEIHLGEPTGKKGTSYCRMFCKQIHMHAHQTYHINNIINNDDFSPDIFSDCIFFSLVTSPGSHQTLHLHPWGWNSHTDLMYILSVTWL